MQRSELVTVPPRSPQPAAGNSKSANWAVSVFGVISETTRNSHFASASRTITESGKETAGFVATTHNARILPLRTASNISTAFKPGLRAIFGAFQKRATRSQFSSVKVMCEANCVASPPTSRPPMAFGWPVIENGDAPGLPMRPVSRCGLISALPLSVP